MLHLQLFGPPLIKTASDTLTQFKSRKGVALLVYLAVTPGQYSRSYLANLLWSEWPEEKALSNLRYALWNLRQTLGELPLSVDRLSITFRPSSAVWTDVVAFRELLKALDNANLGSAEVIGQLQDAVDLYRGDLLAGFALDDAPVFENWLHQQRTALHELAIDALIRLSNHYSDQHSLSEAITTTRRLLELEPWRETEHRQLMLLLARSGRRDAALAHYQHCRQILAAELNLDPEPETTALMERIRLGEIKANQDEAPQITAPLEPARVGASRANQAAEAAPAIAETSVPPVPLVGRNTEHAWLTGRWQQARQGRIQLALIRGEAGVGKTRLIEETVRLVGSQNGLVLHGRCYEFSGPVPYQPIASALKNQIAHFKQRGLPLSQVWLVELAQLLPEVREHYPQLPPPLPSDRSADRYRLFEAVSHFLQALSAEQPVLLFLDDLHWADVDTLDLLGYLMRRLTDSPLLIVGAYRPGEVLNDHALVALQRPLHHEGRNAELELARLSKETVRQLVQTIIPVAEIDRLSFLLYRLSQGNPFIMFETLNEIQERGWLQPGADGLWSLKANSLDQEDLIPDGVQTGIRRRVARLSAESRRLLALAAVIGYPFEAKLLQLASNVRLEQVLEYLDDWLSRHLMREIIGQEQQVASRDSALALHSCLYDFSHDVIRAVVYADLSQARRQIMHTQIGDALEQLYAGKLEQVVELLAHHYHHGYRPGKALVYLQLAGQQAQTVYALPLAFERYQHALNFWERLHSATSHDTPLEARRQRWHLLLSQAEVSRMLGQLQKQQPVLETVLREVTSWGEDRDRLRVIEQQLARLEETAELDQRRRLATQGLRLAHVLGDLLAESHCLKALADCDRDMANFEQALTHYQAALVNFSQLEQTRQVAFCLISIGKIHQVHNRYAEALAQFRQAESYAKNGRYQDALIWSLNAMAHMYLFLGDLKAALTISQEALALCEMIGFDSGASTGLVIQGYIHMLSGRLDQAEQHFERAWTINQEMGQTLRMADVQCCQGYLCLLRGQPEHAVAHFKHAEVLCGNFYSGRAIEARSQRAVAHLALKQRAEALNCSHHAVVWLSGREHNMYAPQRVYFNQYQVLLAQGEVEEAQDALVKAYTMVRLQADNLAEIYPALAQQELSYERFLTSLPWNREIMNVWNELPLATSVTVLRSLHSYPG